MAKPFALMAACGDGAGVSTTGADTDGAGADAIGSFDGSGCPDGGCPCATAADCPSGYCIDTADGGRVCAERCEDAPCPDGWACTSMQDSDGTSVRLCLPAGDVFCEPCATDADCGAGWVVCRDGVDSAFCATACDASGLCPLGAACETVAIDGADRALCIPETGSCADCLDLDGDGFGVGVACAGADCDDDDDTAHEGADEVCNGEDDDCDGAVDEGYDLSTDSEHCGACGAACDPAMGTGACAGGACTIEACDEGWVDCNGDVADGCETDLDGPGFCGACDRLANVCGGCAELPETPGDPCGTCGSGLIVCVTPETVDCVGDLGDAAYNACGGCETLANEPGVACGPCGLDEYTCVEGVTSDSACDGVTLACEPGSGAVCEDGALVGCLEDGCGIGVLDACDACGCADGACLPTVCTPGAERCNARLAQRCDPDGCGWTTFDNCTSFRNNCRFADGRARCLR